MRRGGGESGEGFGRERGGLRGFVRRLGGAEGFGRERGGVRSAGESGGVWGRGEREELRVPLAVSPARRWDPVPVGQHGPSAFPSSERRWIFAFSGLEGGSGGEA